MSKHTAQGYYVNQSVHHEIMSLFFCCEKTAEKNSICQLRNIAHSSLKVSNRSDCNIYANNQHSGEPMITRYYY